MYRPLSNASEIKRACSDILTKLQHSLEMTGSGQKKILVPKIDPNHELSPLMQKDGLPRYDFPSVFNKPCLRNCILKCVVTKKASFGIF